MSEQAVAEVKRRAAGYHPAGKAWTELGAESHGIMKITTLKKTRKSAIYRIRWDDSRHPAVVAKRSRSAAATVERIVYEEGLPAVPVSTLRYFGYVPESDGEYVWLFFEDAGGRPYSPRRLQHRALAGSWLGAVHTAVFQTSLETRLPHHGITHYRLQLSSVMGTILSSLTNPVLRPSDRDTIHAFLAQCDVLASRWDDICSCCSAFPHTLVHGDLVAKNVRVRTDEGQPSFVAFDWEMARWGTAAADIAELMLPGKCSLVSPNLAAYWSIMQATFRHLRFEDVERFAHIGRILRLLDIVSWAVWQLSAESAGKTVGALALYQAEMARTIRGIGLA